MGIIGKSVQRLRAVLTRSEGGSPHHAERVVTPVEQGGSTGAVGYDPMSAYATDESRPAESSPRATAAELRRQYYRAMTMENSPTDFIYGEPRYGEAYVDVAGSTYIKDAGSVALERQLVEHVTAHPELHNDPAWSDWARPASVSGDDQDATEQPTRELALTSRVVPPLSETRDVRIGNGPVPADAADDVAPRWEVTSMSELARNYGEYQTDDISLDRVDHMASEDWLASLSEPPADGARAWLGSNYFYRAEQLWNDGSYLGPDGAHAPYVVSSGWAQWRSGQATPTEDVTGGHAETFDRVRAPTSVGEAGKAWHEAMTSLVNVRLRGDEHLLENAEQAVADTARALAEAEARAAAESADTGGPASEHAGDGGASVDLTDAVRRWRYDRACDRGPHEVERFDGGHAAPEHRTDSLDSTHTTEAHGGSGCLS